MTFQHLLDHIKSLQKIQGEIENLAILSVARLYGHCKVVRQNKTAAELSIERQKSISELGFQE